MADQERESTIVLTRDVIEVRSSYHHHEGSNDYTNTRTDIVGIVDRQGQTLTPVWSADWTTIGEGVDSRADGHSYAIRISAIGCPVRVRFSNFHEYVSYTDSEHSSSWISYYWVRYVTPEVGSG